MGLLNLSDGDTSGFEALDSGRYTAEIFELGMDAVKNTSGQGKMPAGTPMIKCQFKLTGEDANGKSVENRRAFMTLVVPPDGYDEKKAQRMKGMIINFFTALGDDEASVRSADFDPNFGDYLGRSCVVVLGKEPKKDQGGNVIDGEFNNPVKAVKPAGTLVAPAGGLL